MAVPLSLQAVLPLAVAVLPPLVVRPQMEGFNIPRKQLRLKDLISQGTALIHRLHWLTEGRREPFT